MDVLQTIGTTLGKNAALLEEASPDLESWVEFFSANDTLQTIDPETVPSLVPDEFFSETEEAPEEALIEIKPELDEDTTEQVPVSPDINVKEVKENQPESVSLHQHVAVSLWQSKIDGIGASSARAEVSKPETPLIPRQETVVKTDVSGVVQATKSDAAAPLSHVVPAASTPLQLDPEGKTGLSDVQVVRWVSRAETNHIQLARAKTSPELAVPLAIKPVELADKSASVSHQPLGEQSSEPAAQTERGFAPSSQTALQPAQMRTLAEVGVTSVSNVMHGSALGETFKVTNSEAPSGSTEHIGTIASSNVSTMNSAPQFAASPVVSSRDQPILMQVTSSIEAANSGKVELRLDPVELGKVRIVMAARDGVMQATIIAERPETLDLLRRNSDSLDLTFSDQGFSDTELVFQQFDDDDQTTPQDAPGGVFQAEDARSLEDPVANLNSPNSGLDIRL